MGLHQKSRDYLFQEFVSRSYQGASAQVRRTLIALGPDKILLQKNALEFAEEELRKLNDFFSYALHESHENADARLLSLLKSALATPYLAWYVTEKNAQTGSLVLENGLGKKAPDTLSLIAEYSSAPAGKNPLHFVSSRSPLSASLEEQGLPKNPSLIFPRSPRPGFFVLGGKEAELKKILALPFTQILVKMLVYFQPQRPQGRATTKGSDPSAERPPSKPKKP